MTTIDPARLGELALFGGLPRSGLELFADLAEDRVIDAGEAVFLQGDLGQDLFVVVSGTLGVYRAGGGSERRLASLGPGEFFGEMSFIDMQPRAGTVKAEERSELWRWSYTAVRSSYQTDAKSYTLLIMNIAREISRRLRRADAVILEDYNAAGALKSAG